MKNIYPNFRLKNQCLMFFLTTIILMSCQKKETPPKVTECLTNFEKCDCDNEVAFADIKGEVVVLKDNTNTTRMTLLKKGGRYILGGDMVLSQKQVDLIKKKIENPLIYLQGKRPPTPQLRSVDSNFIRTKTRRKIELKTDDDIFRTALAYTTDYWTNRTVYYTINPAVSNQQRIIDAIAHWENNTNIDFVPRTSQASYVEFINIDNVCWSEVGRTGGRQELNIGDACSTGNVIHEIGHTLGFFHEQCREDRDNFIIINYNNIKPGYASQFDKYSAIYGTGGFELGDLDFNSLMLYDSYAFTVNGQPTITRLNGTTFIGQRIGLSQGDIATYNLMYNPTRWARVEYENYNDVWYGNDRYFTDADVFIRFYSDAACTVPANPVIKTQYYENVTNDGITYSYVTDIPTTANSVSLGARRLVDYYEDGSGQGHSSGTYIELAPRVGYTLLSYYIHP